MPLSLLSQEAAADAAFGFAPGTMEAQGQIESGNGTNMGSIGNIFQVVPSTASQPGYGLTSVDGNDPFSVAAYDAALAKVTGSLGGGLEAYNEGIGNYQKDGGASASPAYQNLASSVDNGTTSGGSDSSGGGIGSDLASEAKSTAENPLGAVSGDLGGVASILGAADGSAGSGSSAPQATEQLGTFISSWITRIIIGVLGLIFIAVALSMFKTTAPIVTGARNVVKKTAEGAAGAVAVAA